MVQHRVRLLTLYWWFYANLAPDSRVLDNWAPAHFSGAQLSWAQLSGDGLSGPNLPGTILVHAYAPRCRTNVEIPEKGERAGHATVVVGLAPLSSAATAGHLPSHLSSSSLV